MVMSNQDYIYSQGNKLLTHLPYLGFMQGSTRPWLIQFSQWYPHEN